MDGRNGEKKQEVLFKKSPQRFTRAAGKLGGKPLEDREIEFPREIVFFPLPPLFRNSSVHLFISYKGCASTYAIEMKFLINK